MRLGNHVYITALLLCALSSTSLSAFASISKIDLRQKLIADGLIDPPDLYVDRYAAVLIPPRKPPLPAQLAENAVPAENQITEGPLSAPVPTGGQQLKIEADFVVGNALQGYAARRI